MKPVRGWAVLSPQTWEENPGELTAYGNGAQFQFPIFPTRKEAVTWKAESTWDRGRIVRVQITEVAR